VIKRAILLLVLAYLVAVVALFVVHHDDPPARADAIVVLAGAKSRLPEGERLFARGYAPTLVLSRAKPPSDEQIRLCAHTAVCFTAVPYSTRGEARAIGRIAAQHGWRSIDVVTSDFHVVRTRILVHRCYDGRARIVGSGNSLARLPLDVLKESAKLAFQEAFARGC
jgi:uncharacterized SAM-binding protein YcdF (DUF218 family)